MGGGGGGQEAAAEKSYQLQLQQFEFQKQQLAELEEKEKGRKASEQEILLQLLRRKKIGRRATILTDGIPELPFRKTPPEELLPIWEKQQRETALVVKKQEEERRKQEEERRIAERNRYPRSLGMQGRMIRRSSSLEENHRRANRRGLLTIRTERD